MNRISMFVVLGALTILVASCDHSNEDCCTNPTALVNYGPAGAPPTLLACDTYVVLAGSGVTCTGTTTTVSGDIGCSPSGSITGLPSGQPTHGNKHENDVPASQAQSGCLGAYNDLVARQTNGTLSGLDLGGRTFSSGVYSFSTSCALNGTLVLDAQNNPNAVFVIQIGSTLTCGANSTVVLINGATAKNVYWQCGSSATIGNNCSFRGTLIAQNNIACHAGSSVHGRALARNGTVTLDDCSVELP